jgi:starch synthase (maltosyl-transferring)
MQVVMTRAQGRRRIVIEKVAPELDGGRYPIKRVVGESVTVEADVLADGHDVLSGLLLYRREGESRWNEVPLGYPDNDRWRASFVVSKPGRYRYTVTAWVDSFQSWYRDLGKRLDAGQDVSIDLLIGATLIKEASARARGEAAKRLAASADALHSETKQTSEKVELIRDRSLHTLMADHPDRKWGTTYEKELLVTVDRERARFSAWYEMFPRSCSATPEQHGTFRDCEAWLPYIAGMGFDVLYFSPIHPIGQTHRKGKNNAPTCLPGDVGSPWAIGSHEGGHKAIHPQLGTLADFKRLLAKAKQHGIEVALDIAYQCSPDHPYVKDHPEWFRKRPDGTVQYAENPPKKYQDIYPLDFENEDWKGLWKEMTSIVLYWSKQGVRIFRVDNPHTKPFRFWEHLIVEVKHRYPDVIFLSEAFTRPKVMYNLAKLGFTQSYTYFTWRHTKGDFTQYLTELTQTEIREYFRPNFWPNTPDILIEHLQNGGRPAFAARLIMAATMCSNYGIYGPAFELGEHRPFAPGSEEYLNSEKYELKQWDIEQPDSLKDLITAVNRIRRENPALQTNAGLRFHSVDNEQLLCYTKQSEDCSNIIFVVVNLDRHSRQAGAVDLNLAPLGLSSDQPYHLQDLLTGASYRWRGARNYVEVEAEPVPAQIFQVRR